MMRFLTFLMAAVFLFTTCGCETPGQAARKKKKAEKKEEPAPKPKDIPDAGGDVSFQSFVGRLRKAVGARDIPVLASMMTSNFGYLLEPEEGYSGEGEGVFRYWDENGLWPELQSIVNEKFVPNGNFMVAPPQFASDPPNYTGYRAGLIRLGGSWRFAYFVGN